MINDWRSFFGSISDLALTVTFPLPVWNADEIPTLPQMIPPVGKSGPLICCINSKIVASGLLIN